MTIPTSIILPPINLPLTNQNGNLSDGWYRLLLSLYLRTGGALGISATDVSTAVIAAAETANEAQTAAFAALTAAQNAQAATVTGDALNATAIAAETQARITEDTVLAREITAQNAVAVRNFTYTQSLASNVWVINHGLGIHPSVSVADSAGNLIDGDVFFNNPNQTTLTFSSAFSGTAYLV